MKALIVGDIVGKSGLNRLEKELPRIIHENQIDFCIVNGENSANGKGIRNKEYEEILSYGADVITMGNHLYYRKEMLEEYKKLPKLAIPANIINVEGNKSVVVEKQGVTFGVINLIGKAEMGPMFEKNTTNPFETVLTEIETLKANAVDYIFVDFHAEATAEKLAMGHHLAEHVSCMFGTHTHVQTADDRILPTGMAYITDVGMTGPTDSVIGLKKEVALKRFVTGAYAKYECSSNEAMLNAMIITFDDETKKAVQTERIHSYYTAK